MHYIFLVFLIKKLFMSKNQFNNQDILYIRYSSQWIMNCENNVHLMFSLSLQTSISFKLIIFWSLITSCMN